MSRQSNRIVLYDVDNCRVVKKGQGYIVYDASRELPTLTDGRERRYGFECWNQQDVNKKLAIVKTTNQVVTL